MDRFNPYINTFTFDIPPFFSPPSPSISLFGEVKTANCDSDAVRFYTDNYKISLPPFLISFFFLNWCVCVCGELAVRTLFERDMDLNIFVKRRIVAGSGTGPLS